MKYCRGCKERKELIHFWKADGRFFTQCSGCRSLPRVCTKCKGVKDHSEFFIYVNQVGNYIYKARCKSCDSSVGKEDYKKNPNRRRSCALKYYYGLTLEDYDKLLESQGGVCAICQCPEEGFKKYLSVDHNHETGKIRGLLCNGCNRAIGFTQDNPDILEAAARYLRKST